MSHIQFVNTMRHDTQVAWVHASFLKRFAGRSSFGWFASQNSATNVVIRTHIRCLGTAMDKHPPKAIEYHGDHDLHV